MLLVLGIVICTLGFCLVDYVQGVHEEKRRSDLRKHRDAVYRRMQHRDDDRRS